MNHVLSIFKPIGLTPLQLIQQLRVAKPEYKDATIGYAGRLDPMAEGVMLLMIGDETKNRDQYLSLDKEYTFTALFGVETDTYDFLGLLDNMECKPIPRNVNSIVNTFVSNHIGISEQFYPPYSSKTVNGKPLFLWAKEGKLAEIELPIHKVSIESLVFNEITSITKSHLQSYILSTIALIEGDFRQEAIGRRWKKFFVENSEQTFTQATFHMRCSSGTYVRQLVHDVGGKLGCGAITTRIVRTKLGEYDLENALKLPQK